MFDAISTGQHSSEDSARPVSVGCHLTPDFMRLFSSRTHLVCPICFTIHASKCFSPRRGHREQLTCQHQSRPATISPGNCLAQRKFHVRLSTQVTYGGNSCLKRASHMISSTQESQSRRLIRIDTSLRAGICENMHMTVD